MSNLNPETSIACVQSLDYQPQGTGFVVSSTLAVTCVHVVEACGAGPDGRVHLAFRVGAVTEQAEVLADGWYPELDIAFLRLLTPLPPEVVPAVLGPSIGQEGTQVRAFGYPEVGKVEGLWGEGRLTGRVTEAGQSLLQLSSTQITVGFSGGPVWVERSGNVIGMVIQIAVRDRYGRLQDVAFAVPAKTLHSLRPAEVVIEQSRNKVQLYLHGDFSSLTKDRRSSVIDALAGLLRIPPEAIELYSVYEGSVVFDLGLPAEAFQRLRSLLQSNNAQLRLLRIEKAMLETGPNETEMWIFEEGKFVLADRRDRTGESGLQSFGQGYAVIIGVGADLPMTVPDATAVAELLRDPSRCAYPAGQVRLLTNKDARREAVLSALDWLGEVADSEATAIVYFSGHGLETLNYYLLPYGYDLANLASTAIPGTVFTDKLRAIKAGKLVVLLDCCHAGGQAEAKGWPGVKSPLPPTVAAELARSSGRVVIASSRKDEVSWTGRPYSVFTTALLESLAGYGAFEQDGYARVLDLALWVGRKVPERTQDKQHPIVKVSRLEDNFALAWYAAGEKRPRPFDWTADLPSVAPDLDPAQVTAWQRMLANYRENLLLIEERMSEFVEFTAIPLQLIREKRHTEEKIADLEQKFGLRG